MEKPPQDTTATIAAAVPNTSTTQDFDDSGASRAEKHTFDANYTSSSRDQLPIPGLGKQTEQSEDSPPDYSSKATNQPSFKDYLVLLTTP